MVTIKEALQTAQIKAAASDAILARCSGVKATALPDASFLSATDGIEKEGIGRGKKVEARCVTDRETEVYR